jgi:hypothetical protein
MRFGMWIVVVGGQLAGEVNTCASVRCWAWVGNHTNNPHGAGLCKV